MIEFKNVSKTYETGNRAVRNISLRINDGEFVFIVGRSGSGKSTMLKLITRELKATEGSIVVSGQELEKLKPRQIPKYRRGIGVIFQDFRLLGDRNVYENIAFAQRVIGAPAREIREKVPEILKLTGLSAKYKNMPDQLSGGEQQRVAIARALINRPSVILADEPTGNLDEKNSDEIMKLLYEINAMGTTVIVITHSRAIVEASGRRVIAMNKGTVISDSGADTAHQSTELNIDDFGRVLKASRDKAEKAADKHAAEDKLREADAAMPPAAKPADSHEETETKAEDDTLSEEIDDTLPWDTDDDGKDVVI